MSVNFKEVISFPQRYSNQTFQVSGFLTIVTPELAFLTEKGNWQPNTNSIFVTSPKGGFEEALDYFYVKAEFRKDNTGDPYYYPYQIHPSEYIFQFPAVIRGSLINSENEKFNLQMSNIEFVSADVMMPSKLLQLAYARIYTREAYFESVGEGKYKVTRKLRTATRSKTSSQDSEYKTVTVRGILKEVLHKDYPEDRSTHFVIAVESPIEIKESHHSVWLLPNDYYEFMRQMFMAYQGQLGTAEVTGQLVNIPEGISYPTKIAIPPKTAMSNVSLIMLEDSYFTE